MSEGGMDGRRETRAHARAHLRDMRIDRVVYYPSFVSTTGSKPRKYGHFSCIYTVTINIIVSRDSRHTTNQLIIDKYVRSVSQHLRVSPTAIIL